MGKKHFGCDVPYLPFWILCPRLWQECDHAPASNIHIQGTTHLRRAAHQNGLRWYVLALCAALVLYAGTKSVQCQVCLLKNIRAQMTRNNS